MLSGDILAQFRVIRKLGEGGMGEVYLAEDTKLNRQVALKTLRDDFFGDQDRRDRFEREAKTAAQIQQANVMAIYDIGSAKSADGKTDVHYIVMEYIKGQTLSDFLTANANDIGKLLRVAEKIASGLAAAHKLGIVHRDIKPENIIVDEHEEPKILDFGLAKPIAPLQTTDQAVSGETVKANLTRMGTVIGTVAYMSPEQARGEEVDARTDIFSLGLVLYEMVTGQQAFTGATTAVVFDAILNRAPVSPAVLKPDTPPRLVDAIHTALEKDRALRYQHAEDLEAELKRIRRDLQSGATSATARAASTVVVPPIPATPAAVTPPIPIPAAAVPPMAPPSSGAGTAPVAFPVEPATAKRRSGRGWIVFGLVMAALSYWNSPARRQASSDDPVVDVSRAEQRLAAKDYRAALVEAEAVLKEDDEDDDARRVKRQAEEQLAALDALADRIRTAARVGDVTEAARLLAEAQDLAPGDALLTELSVIVRSATDAPPARATRPAATPARPTAAPAAPAIDPPRPPPPGGPPAPRGDEVEVRRVLDVYRRAVAARDFELFRSIFPALTADDEQRLRASLGPGGPQPLMMRVEQLTIDGPTAEARLAFIDPAPARPRLNQVLGLARQDNAWVIVRLGPPRRRPVRPGQ